MTLVILAVLCAARVRAAAQADAARRRARRRASSSSSRAIGLGFLLLEIALIQRFVLFLGFPTYALSVVLFSLLAFTGIGSLLSTRLATPRRTLIAALAFACVLIAAAAFGLQPLLRALIEWPFAARVALSVVLLAPAGLALGMAMPIGLTRLAGLHPGAVPWAWAVNGIASVLASVLAVAVADHLGLRGRDAARTRLLPRRARRRVARPLAGAGMNGARASRGPASRSPSRDWR